MNSSVRLRLLSGDFVDGEGMVVSPHMARVVVNALYPPTMVFPDLFDARPFKLALAVLSRELSLSLKAGFQILIRVYSSLVI